MPKKTPKIKNNKLQNKIKSLEGQIKRLKTNKKTENKDYSLMSKNRTLTLDVNRLKTEVKSLEDKIDVMKVGLRHLLGNLRGSVSVKS